MKDKKTTTGPQVTPTTETTQEQGTDFGSNSANLDTTAHSGGGGQANVPRTESDVLAAARAACGDDIAALESVQKTADDRLLPFVEKFDAMPQGWTQEAQTLWEEFLGVATGIAKETGDTSGAQVRAIYDGPFTELMNGWNDSLRESSETPEERAKLAHMYRKTLREFSRTLMRDDNAVKVIRARDMVKHGSPFGPSFKTLFDKNRKKTDTDDQAFEAIIGSSTKHDAAASKTVSGGGNSFVPPKAKL